MFEVTINHSGVRSDSLLDTYFSKKQGMGLAPGSLLCDWLTRCGGSLVSIQEVTRDPGPRGGMRDIRGLLFVFSDPREATLMKLTWAGL